MVVTRPGASGGPQTSVTGPGGDVLAEVTVPPLAVGFTTVPVADGLPPPATDPAPEPPHPATDTARAAASMIADVALKAMCGPPGCLGAGITMSILT
jgi:hypothetical protein